MANSLYITYSGGTVDLNSGNIRMLTQYVPKMGDGETTVDSVEIEFSGTAVSQIQTNIQAINKAMQDAVKYTRDGIGTQAYIHFIPDGYNTLDPYRSELIPSSAKEWKLDLDSDSLSDARWVTNTPKRVKGLLTWTRRDYWEDDSDYQIYAYNDGGSLTSQNNILVGMNTDDGFMVNGTIPLQNWIAIDTSMVKGDLPAPIHFELTSAESVLGKLHMGLNCYNAAGTLWTSHIEAESNVYAAAGAGTVAIFECSGGTAVSTPIPSGVNTELLRWNGSSGLSNTFNGQNVNVFLVFGGTVTSDMIQNTKYSLAFTDRTSSVTYFQTDYLHFAGTAITPVKQLATIQVPPGFDALKESYLTTNYYIKLYGRQDTGGTVTPVIDFIHLLPVSSVVAYELKHGQSVVHIDVANDRAYTYDGLTKANPITNIIGEGIYLLPGTEQRLYFFREGTATSQSTHSSVWLSYLTHRPRRRLL